MADEEETVHACFYCRSVLTCICMQCDLRFCYGHSARAVVEDEFLKHLKRTNDPFSDFLFHICMGCIAFRFRSVRILFDELTKERIKEDCPEVISLTPTPPMDELSCRIDFEPQQDSKDHGDSDALVAVFTQFNPFHHPYCTACFRLILDDERRQNVYHELIGEWPCQCALSYGCNCGKVPCVCPMFDPLLRVALENSVKIAKTAWDLKDLPPKKRLKVE